MIYPAALRRALRKLGWTQEEASRKTGVPLRSFKRYLAGDAQPHRPNRKKLLAFLKKACIANVR